MPYEIWHMEYLQIEAQPSGAVGFSSSTSSPGTERETELKLDESHMNISRNRSPLSLRGWRTAMRLRTQKLAPSTRTPQKAKDIVCSPARTSSAARRQSSVGSPSLIRKIQGR